MKPVHCEQCTQPLADGELVMYRGRTFFHYVPDNVLRPQPRDCRMQFSFSRGSPTTYQGIGISYQGKVYDLDGIIEILSPTTIRLNDAKTGLLFDQDLEILLNMGTLYRPKKIKKRKNYKSRG